ncbi:MAG: 3'-5' exonuclease, partial [Paracoccaceae bacterium]
TAGIGTRPGGRTLFVVGDKKQSIYSFQGADVAAFDAKHQAFQRRFLDAGQPFQTLELQYSFRSSPAILNLVDATLNQRFPEAVGANVQHFAYKAQMPGRVDLWPLIEPVETDKDDTWESPVDRVSQTHHNARLARMVAEEIRHLIDAGTQIPTDKGPRAVHEGDFLILVQRRSVLFSDIIRECKKQRLAVAGADRLKLGAELAVKDLAALLSFLALPEDDLSLATILRSPLCGWSEGQLFDLAHGRTRTLWDAMQGSPARTMLEDLRSVADYLRPYELLERALTRHDGRRRLLTRLGDEAMEGIDALLAQAMAYERLEVPSLTGFLVWLETDEIEVKRQMEAQGYRIRVMTVHGAKGLEAPIVILPETADRTPRDSDEVFTPPDAPPVWRTSADESPPLIAAEKARRDQRRQEESIRLLYVALTRARSWLIVAAAGEAKTETKVNNKPVPKDPIALSWYRQVEAGMQALGAVPDADGRRRLAFGDWPMALSPQPTALTVTPALPDWAETLAATPARRPALLLPSALGGAKVMPGDHDPEAEALALERGTALHALLEQMPGLDPILWPRLAENLVADPTLCAEVLDEAAGVLADPALAHLFTTEALTEVAVTCDLQGQRLYGVIDRLLVSPTRVLAIDYKSNRLIPARASEVPEGLLRQMGAYAHALREIYPDRQIDTALLWTKGPHLMPLDPNIVSLALQRATIP